MNESPTSAIKIVLDLPMPPSVNRIWRANRGRIHKSKEYAQWQKDAYYLAKAEKRWPTAKITGPFHFRMELAESQRGDGDNRIKAALDLLQLFGVIRNDSDCESGEWEWVPTKDAPLGCRVTLYAVGDNSLPI